MWVKKELSVQKPRDLAALHGAPPRLPQLTSPPAPMESWGTSHTSRGEYVQILAKRLVYSRAYTIFYASMIIAGIVEVRVNRIVAHTAARCERAPQQPGRTLTGRAPRQVLWIILPGPSSGFGQLPDSVVFTAVETYVTIGLVCELALRAIHGGMKSFCGAKANIFDSAVAAVSVSSSVLIAAGLETPAELLVAEILVIGRILFRLSRLLAITKSFQRQQQAAHRKLDINLGDVSGNGSSQPPTPSLLEPYELEHRAPWARDVEVGGPWSALSWRDESARAT